MLENKNFLDDNRILIFDFVRIAAIVMMLQGHAISSLALPNEISGGFWEIWHFLRKLTGPSFLFVSGAVHVFANKRDAFGRVPNVKLLKRLRMSLLLLFIGYILVMPASRLFYLQYIDYSSKTYFFQVNILQLFSVCLLILILFFKITRTTLSFAYLSFIYSIIVFLIYNMTLNIDWYSFLPEYVAPYLTGSRGSYFPIFPWTAYFFFGASFGALISKLSKEDRVYAIKRLGLLFGIILASVGLALYHYYGKEVLMRLGFVFLILSAFSYFIDYFQGFAKNIQKFAKYSLFIYVLHILILYGSSWFSSVARIYKNTLSV